MSSWVLESIRRSRERRLAELLDKRQGYIRELEHFQTASQDGGWYAEAKVVELKARLEELDKEIDKADRELRKLDAPSWMSTDSYSGSAREYDRATVRDLLLHAFTAADFRRLFLYASHPDLGALVQEFGDGDGLARMVDTAIEQCTKKDLLPDLLREVKKANPRMYARYESRLIG